MLYNKSGSSSGEQQLTKTHGSKHPDLLHDIYVAWIAQNTFSFAYDATMSLYNSNIMVALIINIL